MVHECAWLHFCETQVSEDLHGRQQAQVKNDREQWTGLPGPLPTWTPCKEDLPAHTMEPSGDSAFPRSHLTPFRTLRVCIRCLYMASVLAMLICPQRSREDPGCLVAI